MPDTVVFIPALNEEDNLPAVLDELRDTLPGVDVLVVDDGSTDGTADVARAHGAEVLSFGENRGLREGVAAGYRWAHEQATTRSRAASTRTASTRSTSSAGCSRSSRRTSATSPSAPASRPGDGYEAYRYAPSPSRRFGTAVLRRGMRASLGRPFLDATSGMYAVNAAAMPVLAEPYESGAPEVESLLRLERAKLRVLEVPVHMRERASGESKLRGKRALKLVVTVAGTLLLYGAWRALRGRK